MSHSSAAPARIDPSGGSSPAPTASAPHPAPIPATLPATLPAHAAAPTTWPAAAATTAPAATAAAAETDAHGLDPASVARDLALCVIEIIAGARELETIARWITDDVHRHLQRRVVIAARGRSVRRAIATRPILRAGPVHVSSPAPEVYECTIVVHGRPRTRVVAIRLERGAPRDSRLRATTVSVL